MVCPQCDPNEDQTVYDIPNYMYLKSEITPPMIIQYASRDLLPSYYSQTLLGQIKSKKGALIQCPGKLKKPQNQNDAPEKFEMQLLIEIINNKLPAGVEFIDCPFLLGRDFLNEVQKVYCPICNLTFCTKCLDQGHNGTCEEFKQEKQRLEDEAKALKQRAEKEGQDDIAFRLYMEQNDIRICPNPQCKNAIQKNGGCNRVTCSSCKKSMCWKNKCMQLFDTATQCYAHLNEKHGGYYD